MSGARGAATAAPRLDAKCVHTLHVLLAAEPWPATYRDIGLGSTSVARVHVMHLLRRGLVMVRSGSRVGILLTPRGRIEAMVREGGRDADDDVRGR